jgi:5-(carboxyamino)imidazole ribonucleotide synthase
MVGVLGGGQLGLYFVRAARALGYGTAVLDPDASAPAMCEADHVVIADFDDESALDVLSGLCAVVTCEFENPPSRALEHLARRTLVRPGAHAFAATQDRKLEKEFLIRHGLPTVDWTAVEDDSEDDEIAAILSGGRGAILKTARLGYDGKGQIRLAPGSSPGDVRVAHESLGGVACVLEELVPLDRELSVVVAHSLHAEAVFWAVTENVHVNGILDASFAPYTGSEADEARSLAVEVARALDYVGVLAVELFVSEGSLIINEIAPRPHNSGHWTLDASRTSQFTQQVLTVCGREPAPTTMTSPTVAMVNILGDLWETGEPDFAAMERIPGARVHLYGKSEPRTGRKMGHLTVVGDDRASVVERIADFRRG